MRKRLLMAAWAVTFGLVTWWVATEGRAGAGVAAALGAIVASVVVYGLDRVRR